MKARLIEIDTNGSNSGRFTNNLELYDLITPKIIFLVDNSKEIHLGEEIDWEQTRHYFEPDNNGHCVFFKGNLGYQSAAEFTHLGVAMACYDTTLSGLCDELAKEHNITSWFEGRNDEAYLYYLRSEMDKLAEASFYLERNKASLQSKLANYYKK